MDIKTNEEHYEDLGAFHLFVRQRHNLPLPTCEIAGKQSRKTLVLGEKRCLRLDGFG